MLTQSRAVKPNPGRVLFALAALPLVVACCALACEPGRRNQLMADEYEPSVSWITIALICALRPVE